MGGGLAVAYNLTSAYIILVLVLILAACLVYFFRAFIKRIIISLAKIFNQKIETHILQISWALIWNFKDIFLKISKIKLVIYTIGMWSCYVASYTMYTKYLMASGEVTNWGEIFVLLFAENGIKNSTLVTSGYVSNISIFAVYMLLPLFILLIISIFIASNHSYANSEEISYLTLLPHLDLRERLNFLENYFFNENKDYVNNYLKINQEISIVRDFSAGSNATTMLCMDGEALFFRKYAFGDDGEKLYQQILWIQSNCEHLALPQILRYEKTGAYCYYDMPYNVNAVGLFEYVHSMPIENAWEMIRNVLESLESSIYKKDNELANRDIINHYISTKVEKNIDKIKNSRSISNLLQYEKIFINGVEYNNFNFYKKYLDSEYLYEVFKNDEYSIIHGDLTIENIICTRNTLGMDEFYIIDPNTGNVHESPNLDYAKLLQSLHGGYEFLMSTKNVTVVDNKVNFLFTKSFAYRELHNILQGYMLEHFGAERTKSIYFHEIIHWLRLMPYKIDKDDKRSVLFFAGMLIVMHDVVEMFEQD